MKVLVDGKEMSASLGVSRPWAQCYGEIIDQLFDAGRTVVSVTRDGALLKEGELSGFLEREDPTGATLELQTVGTSDLTCGTLREVLKHFEPLRKGLGITIEHLGRADRVKALEAFRPTLEIWLGVCEAVQKVCVLSGVDANAETTGVNVTEAHEKIIGTLREIQSSFEQQDWVKLADLLEYEMIPAVGQWEALTSALLGTLQADDKA